MAPHFFVPDSAEVRSLRDCIGQCGAAGGTPACGSALAIASNVQCNGTETAGTCDVWLGHHRHEFGSGPFDSCLASSMAEPAAPVAPSYSGSSYGNAVGDCCVLSAGELFEVPCDYHSNFDNAAKGLRCLCETPGSVASTVDAIAWLDAWTEADLERRRGYLLPAILAVAFLALLPWLISCSVACIRGRCRTARATTTSDTDLHPGLLPCRARHYHQQ